MGKAVSPSHTHVATTHDGQGTPKGGCNLHAWTPMVSGWEVGKELIHTKFLANALCCCWLGAASTMPTSECVHPLHPAPAQASIQMQRVPAFTDGQGGGDWEGLWALGGRAS